MSRKTVYYITLGIGLFCLIFSLMAVMYGFSVLPLLPNLSEVGMDYRYNEKNQAIDVIVVISNSSAEFSGLHSGDQVLAIDGIKPTAAASRFENVFGVLKAGTRVQLTVRRGEKVIPITFVKIAKPYRKIITRLTLIFAGALIMLIFTAVGLWGLYKVKMAGESILIALICFCFGALTYWNLFMIYYETFVTHLKFRDFAEHLYILYVFLPSFWLLLFCNYPHQNRFYRKHRLLINTAIFMIPVLYIFEQITQITLIPIGTLISQANQYFIYIGIIAGIVIFAYNYKHTSAVREKRQLRLILFGLKFAGAAVIIGQLAEYTLRLINNIPNVPFALGLYYINLLSQIACLVVPFTFLNSFFHKNILETESELKRKLTYLGVVSAVFFFYLGVIYLLGQFFIGLLQLRHTSAILVFSFLLTAMLFSPIKHTQNWLLSKIHPERTRFQHSLRSFVKQIQGAVEVEEMLGTVGSWLENVSRTKPALAYPLFGRLSTPLPFKTEAENSVLTQLKNGDTFFWDELTVETQQTVNSAEIAWARQHEISISMPMISFGELVGILNLGKKENRRDFSSDDLNIFKESIVQVAIVLQNLKLQLVNLEKKRLDKELEIARIIQQQLLPQQIPTVAGLTLHGQMRSCYEVAGDYFDIIPLDKNKTVLALADVSGKGAGAALLMANLQAGLRAFLRLTQSLPLISCELNNIIHQNTNSAQFITFFVGIWDNESMTFSYVNAGHNPPLISGANGAIKKLEATGVVLGALPDMKFTENHITMQKNDILTIFTDGIEEVANSADEEFGTKRIIFVIQEHASETPKEISAALFQSLEIFAAGTPFRDDATVIIAKVTPAQ